MTKIREDSNRSVYVVSENDAPFPNLVTHVDRFQSEKFSFFERKSTDREITFRGDPFRQAWRFRICPVFRFSPSPKIDSTRRHRTDRRIYFELSSWRICPNKNPEMISNWSLICAIHATNTTLSKNYFHSADRWAKRLRIRVYERFLFLVWKWPTAPGEMKSIDFVRFVFSFLTLSL